MQSVLIKKPYIEIFGPNKMGDINSFNINISDLCNALNIILIIINKTKIIDTSLKYIKFLFKQLYGVINKNIYKEPKTN